MALVIPFYMLFARKGYLAIYRYFKHHHGYGSVKSFCKTYQNHFVFGQCMLDRFAVYAGRRNFFEIECTGNDYFYQLLDSEKGFVVAGSHVGNFELSGYLLHQDKKRIHAVMYSGEAKEVMENRLKALNMNEICVVPVTGDMSHIFALNDALQRGEIVSIASDRHLGSLQSVECDFLNGKADFPQGTFALAATFEVPVIAVFVIKKSISKYHVYVQPLSIDYDKMKNKREKICALAQSFASELENILRKHPEQWFNFYEFWK